MPQNQTTHDPASAEERWVACFDDWAGVRVVVPAAWLRYLFRKPWLGMLILLTAVVATTVKAVFVVAVLAAIGVFNGIRLREWEDAVLCVLALVFGPLALNLLSLAVKAAFPLLCVAFFLWVYICYKSPPHVRDTQVDPQTQERLRRLRGSRRR